MRVSITSTVLGLLGVATAATTSMKVCNEDNCLRAIQASAFPTRHGTADCSSYFLTTVTPATTTITHTATATVSSTSVKDITATSTLDVTAISTEEETATSTLDIEITTLMLTAVTSTLDVVATDVIDTTVTVVTESVVAGSDIVARQLTVTPSSIPAYASACSGSVGYSSACSCVGVTAHTTTAPTPSTTTTVTMTSVTIISKTITDSTHINTVTDLTTFATVTDSTVIDTLITATVVDVTTTTTVIATVTDSTDTIVTAVATTTVCPAPLPTFLLQAPGTSGEAQYVEVSSLIGGIATLTADESLATLFTLSGAVFLNLHIAGTSSIAYYLLNEYNGQQAAPQENVLFSDPNLLSGGVELITCVVPQCTTQLNCGTFLLAPGNTVDVGTPTALYPEITFNQVAPP